MILELLGSFAIGVFLTFLVLPWLEQGTRQHRQQVRQLKRNILQQKIAEKQLDLERRLDGRANCDYSPDHVWSPWSVPKITRIQGGGLDADQWRVCTSCNQLETRTEHNGGWALK